jgi:hypothetical protein
VIDRLGDDARRDATNAGLRTKVAARGPDEKHAAGIMVAMSSNPRRQHFRGDDMVACAALSKRLCLHSSPKLYMDTRELGANLFLFFFDDAVGGGGGLGADKGARAQYNCRGMAPWPTCCLRRGAPTAPQSKICAWYPPKKNLG